MFTVRSDQDADSCPGCDQTMRKCPGQWAVLWKHVNHQGVAGLDEASGLAELSKSSGAGSAWVWVPQGSTHLPQRITSPWGSQNTVSPLSGEFRFLLISSGSMTCFLGLFPSKTGSESGTTLKGI